MRQHPDMIEFAVAEDDHITVSSKVDGFVKTRNGLMLSYNFLLSWVV